MNVESGLNRLNLTQHRMLVMNKTLDTHFNFSLIYFKDESLYQLILSQC